MPAGRRVRRLERDFFAGGVTATTAEKSGEAPQYVQAARVPLAGRVSASFGGSFPGVAPGVGFLQVGDGEPEVFFGGGDRAMAEHLLDKADIGPVAALDEVCCACVPPYMAGDVFFNAGESCVSLHDVAESVRVNGTSPGAQEEGFAWSGCELRADGVGVGLDPFGGMRSDGDDTVMSAFAGINSQELLFKVHVGGSHRPEFRRAKAGGVEGFQDCPVPHAKGGAGVGSLDDAQGFRRG